MSSPAGGALTLAQARKLFKGMADELTTVHVEGWQAQLLTTMLPAIQQSEPSYSVRLLPYFDPCTIAAVARHSDALLPAAQKNRVYRAQGPDRASALGRWADCRVWEHASNGSRLR